MVKLGVKGIGSAIVLALLVIVIGNMADSAMAARFERTKNEAAFTATFGVEAPKDEEECAWVQPVVLHVLSELRASYQKQNQIKEGALIDLTATREIRDKEIVLLNAHGVRLANALELAKTYNLPTH